MDNSSREHYGSWIRATRQGKGISIDEASKGTNIDRQYLSALEAGNVALLPEPYMRAFLKTYAGYLGLDPVDVLRRFEVFLREESESLDIIRDTIREREGRRLPAARERETRDPDPHAASPAREKAPSRAASPAAARPRSASFQPRRTRSFAVPAVIILVAVVIIAVVGSILNTPGPLPGTGDDEIPAVVDDSAGSVETTVPVEDAQQPTEPSSLPGTEPRSVEDAPLEFVAEALEDTWMQAIADGDTVVTRVVTEGGQIEVAFSDTLALKIGKNHGMRLWFNGEELTDLGSEGMIISFLLTVDGMRQRRLTYPPETIPDYLNIPPGP